MEEEGENCEIIVDSDKGESSSKKDNNLSACKHFAKALKKDPSIFDNYALVHAFYVACIEPNSLDKKKKDCICRSKKCTRTRIHACLSCVHFGCKKHIRTHAKQAKHRLFVDTDSGNVFCSRCKDYQYEMNFMQISEEQNFIAYQKRGGVIFQKEPNFQEPEDLSDSDIQFDATINISNGLTNMNLVSCYMNAIVQAMVHAPIFRDYLLSCKHKCKNFQLDLEEAALKVNLCALCEMINIVQKIFSGTAENYVLGNLLYPFWLFLKRHGLLFDEPKTRDAGEFFEELLNLLHADSLKLDDQSNALESSPCQCIIHSIFAFSLGYEKICKSCLHVNESNEMFWNMPLGLDDLPELSLDYCLKRYFQEEEIPDYKCNSCKTPLGCISKLYVKQLPLVLSFLLNKNPVFQAMSRGTRSKKATTEKQGANNDSLKCPEFLDMSPYVLPSVAENQMQCMFYLFAVLIRVGDAHNGHFYCYVRLTQDRWILCDDHEVIPVSQEEINFKDTRMLFYHRQFVPYLKVENDMVVHHEEYDMVDPEESDMVVQEESDMVVQEESDMMAPGPSGVGVQKERYMVVQEEIDSD